MIDFVPKLNPMSMADLEMISSKQMRALEQDAILRPILTALDEASGADIRTLSVDVPTGYDTDADTGALLSTTPFEAGLIVASHRRKPVHAVLEDAGYRVFAKDIGL